MLKADKEFPVSSSENIRLHIITAMFWLAAAFILFYMLGHRSLWGSEGRWAEVTREMLLFQDFFHPQINGQPYFDKPLLTYWAIIPASWVSGGLNELACRLPSAIAGIATLWGIMYLGKRLSGNRAGLLAGGLLLASWGFCFWSRTAAADSENMAVIVLALCCYFRFRHKPGFYPYLAFYLICAIGAHFKGLTAIAVPVVALLPDMLRKGRWKTHVNMANIVAMALAALIYVLPFAYAAMTAKGYSENGLTLALRENVIRFFKAFDHQDPFYCYIYYLPFLMFPWIFLAIAALYDRIRNFRLLDEGQQWIALALLSIFLLFSLSTSRRSYYILPAVPFLSLFMADFIMHPGNQRTKTLAISCQEIFLFLIAVVETASPAIWPLSEKFTGFAAPLSLQVSTALIGVFALLFMGAGRIAWLWPGKTVSVETRRMISMVICASVLLGGFFCFQQNSLEVYRSKKPFILKLKTMIPGIPPEKIGLSKIMAGVVFYLDMPRPVKDVGKRENLMKFLDQHGRKVIIARKKDSHKVLPFLTREQSSLILSAPEYPWSKRNRYGLEAWEIR